jgi:hypothetical protein
MVEFAGILQSCRRLFVPGFASAYTGGWEIDPRQVIGHSILRIGLLNPSAFAGSVRYDENAVTFMWRKVHRSVTDVLAKWR